MGMSIRDMADRSELSKNTILRIEQGLGSQDASIRLMCRTLRLDYDALIGVNYNEPARVTLHREGDGDWYDLLTYRFDLPNQPLNEEGRKDPSVVPYTVLKSWMLDKGFMPHFVQLNAATPMRAHRGREFMLVLRGQVRVIVSSENYDLKEGESINFWAVENHCYEPLGDETPLILSIVLDPYPGIVLEKSPRGKLRRPKASGTTE